MSAADLTPLLALAERVFTLVDAGDHPALQALMTEPAARELTRDPVLGTWTQVAAESGNLTGRRTGLLVVAVGTPDLPI